MCCISHITKFVYLIYFFKESFSHKSKMKKRKPFFFFRYCKNKMLTSGKWFLKNSFLKKIPNFRCKTNLLLSFNFNQTKGVSNLLDGKNNDIVF